MGHVQLAQIVFDRDALSPDEDVAVITQHWRGAEADVPDSIIDMDETRRSSAVDKIMAMLNGIQNRITNKLALREIRWYDTAPLGQGPGPAVAVYPRTFSGTAVDSALPPQVALSITWRTDLRKNWGRYYLPGFCSPSLTPTGRCLSSVLDQVEAATSPLADRGSTVEETLTVWSPTEQTHHDPQTLQIDDIFDVIRSRRFTKAINKNQSGLG